jgi:hypothetical protein
MTVLLIANLVVSTLSLALLGAGAWALLIALKAFNQGASVPPKPDVQTARGPVQTAGQTERPRLIKGGRSE